nr:hypothetical protein [Tanacetum cinerariifolium]
LESVKDRLLVYKQNEYVFEENIKLLNIEVQLKDTTLVTLRQKLEKAEQERDDLKLKFQPSGGYHVIPLPYTGTFMPPKPDLVFNTAPIAIEIDHSAFNVQLSPPKSNQDLSHITRPTTPIIEDWPVETSILAATPTPTSQKSASSGQRRNRKACFVCKSMDHLIKDCDYHAKKVAQPTLRNYAHKGNHKEYAPLTHTNPQKHMVPTVVLTQSKPVFNTAVRPVSAAMPKINVTRPSYAHPVVTKSKSPIRRHITRSPSPKTSNSPPRVTAVQALVVSAAQGMQGKWGNPQHALKDKGVINSGYSRHMIGNMSYLYDFEELNDRYVAFEGNPKGGKISGKGKIKTLKGNLVRGLPIKVYENDNTCVACKKGKQHRASCKIKPVSSVDQPLYRLHMYLFGLTFVKSLNKKSYCLIFTDDYSRFTWVFFLATKDETSPIVKTFITGLENQLSLKVKVIRSDNGTEFKNNDLNQFCEIKGIKREFSVPRTPQQNGIVERKNKTLIEAARTMLADSLLPILFWAEAVNIACYVQNRVLVTKPHNKTLYELLHGRTPSISFLRPFGCLVTILNTLNPLGKFEGKVDEGFLVGYSISSKSFRVFNSRTRIVQETLHVNFLENKTNVADSGPTCFFDIGSLTRTMNYQPVNAENQTNPSAGFQDKFDAEKAGEEVDQQYVLFPVWSSGSINHQNNDGDATFDGKEHDFDVKKPESKVNVSPSSSAQSRKQDDKTKKEAKRKSHVNAAGTIVLTVGQNSPNSTNTFSVAGPSNVAASPTYGKSSFLDASQLPDDSDMPELEDINYSNNEDAVGVEVDFNNLETSITEEPKRVHQALKDPSWIEALQEELLQFKIQKVWVLVDLPHGKRVIDTKWVYMNKKDERDIVIRNKARLVVQVHIQEETVEEEVYVCQPLGFENLDHPDKVYKVVKKGDIQLVQIYVDDIIFGATNKDLCKSFEKLMKDKFQMSSMGELTFFLGLQVKQKKVGIFISQDKYVAEILKKFGLTEGKSASTSIDTEKPLLKDPDGEDVDVHTYRSMIGSLMYLTSSRPDIMFAVNDVTRLQALVDKKKVVVTEAAIRDVLRLDDAEGVDCIPNEEIFTELARMGYEKPSTKLTFYKAFFSSQ